MLVIFLIILGTLLYASFGTMVALKEINMRLFKGTAFELWVRAIIFVVLWPIYKVLDIVYF